MDAWLPTNEWRWSNSYPQPLPSEEAEFSFPHISLSNSEPLKVGKWRHFFILRGHRKGLEISIHCPLNWEAGWPSWFSPGGNSFIGLFYHVCSFLGGLRKVVTISALLCLTNFRFLFLFGGLRKGFFTMSALFSFFFPCFGGCEKCFTISALFSFFWGCEMLFTISALFSFSASFSRVAFSSACRLCSASWFVKYFKYLTDTQNIFRSMKWNIN